MKKRYFDKPTQVIFSDGEGNTYLPGIAFRDEVFCLDCGGLLLLEDVDIIKEFQKWASIPVEIIDD